MSVDTTVKKVGGQASPHGEMDQTYLVSGERAPLRLWRNEEPQSKPATRREYETVGYVLSGRAELTVEGQTITLDAGDFWLVPSTPIESSRASLRKRPRLPRRHMEEILRSEPSCPEMHILPAIAARTAEQHTVTEKGEQTCRQPGSP